MATVDFNSQYYPYEKVQTGYNTMKGAEYIPLKILLYLMDMADKEGYVPIDDNERARVRLMKYLYYDGANPLANALPTDAQKRSMLFDGANPVLDKDSEKAKHPVGYRLYPVEYWQQAELLAKTVLKCYIGRVVPVSPFREEIGIVFEIITNYALDNTTKTTAYSKTYAMECALIEALHGVNIAGVGVINFDRRIHGDAGSRPAHDNGVHIYRIVNMSLSWQETTENAD